MDKTNGNARRIKALDSTIDAAKKSGSAWAQRFIDLSRVDPDGHDLEGWIHDAVSFFGERSAELDAFYKTLQLACVGGDPSKKIVEANACVAAIAVTLTNRRCDEDGGGLTDRVLEGLSMAALDLLGQACGERS